MKFARREAAFGLLATSLLLPGCAKTVTAAGGAAGPAPASGPPLRVAGATMTVEIASVMLAMQDRYPGAQVQNGGVVSLIAAENPADLATNAETQALRQSVKRPDIRIIMTLVEGKYRIVARRSAGIATLADLKGKRIATLQGTSAAFFLAKMLGTVGLRETDVVLPRIMPLQNMVPAIAQSQIDAVAIWEPFSENVDRALGGDAISFSGEGIYRELFNLNSTAGVLADPRKRAEVVAFVRAVIAANAKMNRNPAEAQAVIAKSGGYTVAEVANSWRHHDFSASLPADMLDVMAEEELWLAASENRQPRSRDQLAPLIDRSIYEEATRAA